MKIAGTTVDAEEREEIEDIVKVFLIAQRMKSLYSRKSQKKGRKEFLKNFTEDNNFDQDQFSLFSVRGLN